MKCLQVTGLLFDLFGVILMAATILKVDTTNTSTTWNEVEAIKKEKIKEKYQAVWGLSFIAIGFILQIIALLLE